MDFEFHGVEVFDAVVGGIVRVHVDVRLGADDAFVELEIAVGSHQHAAGGAFDIAGHADRDVEAERDGIGVGEFDLVEAAAGAEDAEIGNDAAAGANESDRLLGAVLALLVEPFHRRQLVARPEQGFHGGLREVAMAGGNVNQQCVGDLGRGGERQSHAGINLFANKVFDNSSGRWWCLRRGHRCAWFRFFGLTGQEKNQKFPKKTQKNLSDACD